MNREAFEAFVATTCRAKRRSFFRLLSPLNVLFVAAAIFSSNALAAHGTAGSQSGSEPKPSSTIAGAKPKFDVVTIKPTDPNVSSGTLFKVNGNHLIAANVDLLDLISFAYGLHAKQIVSAPRWLETNRFDIDGIPNIEGRPNRDQQRLLFQVLLADRFQLAFHYEKKELPVYALAIDKSGPKLTITDRKLTDGTNFSYTNLVVLTVRNASMSSFADGMQATFLDRPVVDQTGLKDRYDFILKWTPDESPSKDDPNAPPGLYTAIKEQLGLKLVPTKAPVNALIIDKVEKPSAN